MRKHACVALMFIAGSTACMTNGTHRELLEQALQEERGKHDLEMRRARAAFEGELSKVKADRDAKVAKAENDLKQLGLDMTQAAQQFGDQLASTKAKLEALEKQREAAEQEAAAFRAVAEKLKSMVDAGQLEVVTRKGRMTLKLPDEILFPAGSKQLKKDGKAALISVAQVLQSVEDRDFLIAGHTDNIPVRTAAFRSNWDLSTARAVEVVNLMIDNGVPPTRVAAAGFGEHDPIGDNTTPEGRQQNRRLEIIIMPKIEDLGGVGL